MESVSAYVSASWERATRFDYAVSIGAGKRIAERKLINLTCEPGLKGSDARPSPVVQNRTRPSKAGTRNILHISQNQSMRSIEVGKAFVELRNELVAIGPDRRLETRLSLHIID